MPVLGQHGKIGVPAGSRGLSLYHSERSEESALARDRPCQAPRVTLSYTHGAVEGIVMKAGGPRGVWAQELRRLFVEPALSIANGLRVIEQGAEWPVNSIFRGEYPKRRIHNSRTLPEGCLNVWVLVLSGVSCLGSRA